MPKETSVVLNILAAFSNSTKAGKERNNEINSPAPKPESTSFKVSSGKECICLHQDGLDIQPFLVEGIVGINQSLAVPLQTKNDTIYSL